MKKLILVLIFALCLLLFVGCTAETPAPVTPDAPAVETPAETPTETPAEPPAEQPAANTIDLVIDGETISYPINEDGTVTAPMELDVLNEDWWVTVNYTVVDGETELISQDSYLWDDRYDMDSNTLSNETLKEHKGQIYRLIREMDGVPAGTLLAPQAVSYPNGEMNFKSDDYAPTLEFRTWPEGETVRIHFPEGGKMNQYLEKPDSLAMRSGTFTVVTEVFDGGQAVTQLILDLQEEISAADIDVKDIEAYARHAAAKRRVTDAYPSDADGNRQETGHYLTLDLKHDYVGFGFSDNASTMRYNMSTWTNELIDLDHTVTIGDKFFVQGDIVNRLEDEFSFEVHESGLQYRLFQPAEAAESARPLIIWYHGMGEGGSDNRLQIIGNKACNFAAPENQAHFGGAYVIAPQCPDFWAGGFNFGGRSPYVDDMLALIEEAVATYNIDTSRIYVGGCSMGGYMTWQTILAAPDVFAATFPTCAAYAPTTADAEAIAESGLPVWVIYAANDNTVNPDEFPRASVAALEAAGADVRFTEFETVTEGGVSYDGHYSWVYVYNNHVYDTDGTSLMEWMAAQVRE